MDWAIHWCTTPKKRGYYATIDGKLYYGNRGKIVFRNRGFIKQSLRYSYIYYEVRKCADNYYEFVKGTDKEKRQSVIREEFWQEFLNSGRVKFHTVELTGE